jgi:putative solute:sodium symporter small subunit
MSNTNPDDDDKSTVPDGGVAAEEAEINYLETEINLLSPSTPFMRDHLKLVWGTFIAWLLVVWGPVTLTWLAPEVMTTTVPAIGFPLHYFLVALGAPTGALVLAFVYARQRDKLDEKYGIDHSAPVETASDESEESEEAAVTDGGVDQ